MRATRTRRRFYARLLCYLLSYTLAFMFLAPPVWKIGASPATARGAGKAVNSAPAGAAQADAPRRDGELLVRFRADLPEQDRESIARGHGLRRKGKLRGESGAERLELQPGQDPAAAAEQLRARPEVELAEPNYLIKRDEVTPNDPRFAEQWALRNTGQAGGAAGSDIRASAAWSETTGSSSTVVAVVDSGIDFTHPDLKSNEWTNAAEVAGNNRDDDRDGYVDDTNGWDWVTDSPVIRDDAGHGTAVAGIIAAEGNNAEGVSGVMWHASLMSLRVLDSAGTGDIASAVEAIDYAVTHGASVINCSWGTDAGSQLLKDAIDRAGKRGAVVVTSAGNGSRDIDSQPYYPASYNLPNLIAVASSDGFDNLANFSNWGAKSVAVAAPGSAILTTQIGGGYSWATGTSASAPLVAGIAGLLKTLRPAATAVSVRSAIAGSARQVGALDGKVSSGGVADAEGALAALNGSPYAHGRNGNGGNGNGNGQGNGGSQGYVPPALRHDNDHGRANGHKGLVVDPPPAVKGAPSDHLPNLDYARKIRTSPTVSPQTGTIQANVCADCDPSGGGGAGGSDPYFGTARKLKANETGKPDVTLGSRNFNWSLPLVSLPGRAGLDLSFVLYYNSLVWTKQGYSVEYNADHGTPAPGFQLGLPRLQSQFVDADTGAAAYTMITPSGGRVEMRQTGTAGVYESADSTYTQLTFSGSVPVVRTTDGTQYVFGTAVSGEWRCTLIEDRNGNYISASYDGATGHLLSIADTLGRVVNLNYYGDGNLWTITQTWGGATHTYATFVYGSVTMSPNFPGLAVYGTYGGASQTVLSYVVFPDNESYFFDYNSYGQVYQIRHKAPDGHELGHTRYNISDSDIAGAPQSDCPRFTASYEYAQDWNNNQEAQTSYAEAADNSWSQVTAPDGTVYKEFYYTSGWPAGLTYQTELWSGGARKRYTTVSWTQDDTTLPYQKNPRVYETNVYDDLGHRRRTTTDYDQYASYGLPHVVTEYDADGTTALRRTYSDYNLDAAYVNRRIIGLMFQRAVYDGAWNLVSKVQYYYDWGGSDMFLDTPAPATQHDRTNYGPSFLTGRGNLSDIIRYDVNDPNNANGTTQETKFRYNVTGSVLMQRDHLWHATYFDYGDWFSDGVNRNTFAYPTTVTDADGYSSTKQYNYDFGAVTFTHTPTSGTGASVTYADVATQYDQYGRVQQETNQTSGTYRRYVYDAGDTYVQTFETITGTTQADEFYSIQVFDGAGRVRASASDHPGSAGGYAAQYTVYDVMGRASQQAKPTEINGSWVPTGDDPAWVVTTQTYDYKGRPVQTSNPDGSTVVFDYGGCGCAGGDVTTMHDEHGRQKRYTKDALGRLVTTEELNWDGTSVYSTTTYSYNARDQITQISQQGQLRTFGYDGHGRLASRTTPEQGTISYSYNGDDTVNTITDARGATQTFGYNGRHLVTSISYGVPAGVQATPNVTYAYDAAGNRTQMTDGQGTVTYHYDNLSRMDWEERYFNNVGSFRLYYGYNPGGELTWFMNAWGAQVSYTYDRAGRLNAVGGANYAGVSNYASGITYRAFDSVKGMNYSNGRTFSSAFDSRMRPTTWNVSGVLGYNYAYDYFNEKTGRVTYAQSIYDSTLDRSYEYDNVGRLLISHTGAEARAHAYSGQWGTMDGPYSQGYEYDVWGNVTHRYGWGGEVQGGGAGQSSDKYYYYSNNRRTDSGFTYDAAGDLTFDGGQHFYYDADGRQTYVDWTNLSQGYDGDGMRVSRTEDGTLPALFLRSSVLGGQVVAEIDLYNGSWTWWRGYVYAGSELLAVQQGGVFFVHEDPITKSKRVTDMAGNVQSAVELDPYGADTSRSSNSAFQPRKFTSYERDANGTDEATMRRYNRWHSRFDQPDPSDGSYDFTNPQTFNRYAYVHGDPVNYTDPSGLIAEGPVCGWKQDKNGEWTPVQCPIVEIITIVDPFGPGPIGGIPQEGPSGPVVDPSTLGPPPPNHTACDLKLAKIFGGPGAVVGSTSDPGTLEFYQKRGRHPGDYLPRAPGHGPEPYNNPDPKSKDRGGIIHIYGDPSGTSMTNGLYAPSGGTIGPIFTTSTGNVQRNVTYPGGITISFVHVIPAAGNDRNSMGSIRIGNIGGPDSSTDPGYRHTHIVFFKNGARTDPRSLYCKEFGY